MAARRILILIATALVLALGGAGCGGAGGAKSANGANDEPRIEDAFDGAPDMMLVLRPAKIARDPLYGPLFRRVSRMAAARTAFAATLGTTALDSVERSEEVLFAAYASKETDAIFAMRGVPAEVEPGRVLDAEGRPLWEKIRDFPRGVTEYAPAGNAAATLFVLPKRAWVVAVGASATMRVRSHFVEQSRGADPGFASLDPNALALVRFRGDAIARSRGSLRQGALAPVLRDLDHVTLSLAPGPEGSIGEVAARFVYATEPSAAASEVRLNDVVLAFTRRYEKTAPWIRAVKVTREERAVNVRGRIPRAWADGLAHLDVGDISL